MDEIIEDCPLSYVCNEKWDELIDIHEDRQQIVFYLFRTLDRLS